MNWRSRGGGFRLWAAILAVYALVLHAPAMAASGHVDGPVVVAAAGEHAHGEPAAPGHHAADERANTCCIVCGGGPCAAGPVGAGILALPLPLARSRRLRSAPRLPVPHERRRFWFEARGPPRAV
ncbi:MAG: hypothetical protein ACWA6X_13125 [Bauldia sp.]